MDEHNNISQSASCQVLDGQEREKEEWEARKKEKQVEKTKVPDLPVSNSRMWFGPSFSLQLGLQAPIKYRSLS
jgi:hypothetical protein